MQDYSVFQQWARPVLGEGYGCGSQLLLST